MIRFTGGEPLLREDFEEIYVFTRKSGLKVSVFTNATLITPHLAKLLVKLPPLGKIEITVYGVKKESYEAATRVNGSFDACRRGVALLLKNRVSFIVRGALLPQAMGEIDEFEKWVARMRFMHTPVAYTMLFDLRSHRDSHRKNREIKRLRLKPEEVLMMLTRHGADYVKEMKKFCARFMGPTGNKLFSCGSGISNGYVNAYGGLQICPLLRHEECIYDLRSSPLKNAFLDFFPNLHQRKVGNPEYLQRCAKCFLHGLCEQCPAKSYTEYGVLDAPVEYYCEIAHVQAKFLGLLAKNERAWEIKDWSLRVRKFLKNEGCSKIGFLKNR